jgi:hypothetical protein
MSSEGYYPCTWDQNESLTWQFNGNIGHGSVTRTWTVEPALDPARVRQAWLHVLAKHPALTVEYSLGEDGFWRQRPRAAAACDSFVIDAPNCDNTTRSLIERNTEPLYKRPVSLIIDTRSDRTILHLFLDHIPIDGYSMQSIIGDFGRYLSGAAYEGDRDLRFFEFCSTYGATPGNCGPLPLTESTIKPYEPVPRSTGPLQPYSQDCTAAVRRYKVPLAELSLPARRSIAGIAPAIGAAALARAAGGGVEEVYTLVTVPGRRNDTLTAVGRFLGYVMIALPADEPDLLVTARRIYGRILTAAKPRTPLPMSRVAAALAPHRSASKYKQPRQMLPYMAIDHSRPEPELVVPGHRTHLDAGGPEIYLGAAAVYSGVDDENFSITVGIRTDHVSTSVFDTFEKLIDEFRV